MAHLTSIAESLICARHCTGAKKSGTYQGSEYPAQEAHSQPSGEVVQVNQQLRSVAGIKTGI